MAFLENRIPPPLVTLLCAMGMWLVASYKPMFDIELLGSYMVVLFVTLGILFGLLGTLAFHKAKTTVNPLKLELSSALVSSGIYKFTRNPMYLGLGLMLAAWAVTLASWWCFIFLIFYFIFMQQFQIIPEERALQKIFGDDFVNYKSRVRMWM